MRPAFIVIAACVVLVTPWPHAAAALPRDHDALQLELALSTPATIEPGADVRVTAVLVNTSATRTLHVVKPGDGSEVGWREPWVHYTATRIAPDGASHAVPEVMVGRCGLFDPDWVKDIVALAPGERLDLHTWIPDPSRALALDELGEVQIRMHYVFRGGGSDRFPGATPPALAHPLTGVDGFEVVSAPVTVIIESPLALRATLRPGAATLRVGRTARLSDLLDLAIVNTSGAPARVTSPGTPYTFAFETRPGGFMLGFELPIPSTTPKSKTLAPGERLLLLGASVLFSARADGTWTPTTPGPVTVQVVYHEHALGRLKRKLVSAPVTFIVAPPEP